MYGVPNKMFSEYHRLLSTPILPYSVHELTDAHDLLSHYWKEIVYSLAHPESSCSTQETTILHMLWIGLSIDWVWKYFRLAKYTTAVNWELCKITLRKAFYVFVFKLFFCFNGILSCSNHFLWSVEVFKRIPLLHIPNGIPPTFVFMSFKTKSNLK